MKIQSLQNQQVQNRPNFSASARVDISNGSQEVIKLLESLRKVFKEFFYCTVITEDEKRFMSFAGDTATLRRYAERPIELVVERVDGSKMTFLRHDTRFNGIPSPSDKRFDEVTGILDVKPIARRTPPPIPQDRIRR